MDSLFTQDGIQFLLRWLHFLAGITWIGILYYFNFIQTPFFKTAEADVRSGMIRGLVPSALWWFRWGAMFTFLTGWTIITLKTHGGIMGTLMWYNVWFVIWPAQKVVIRSAEQVAGGGEAIPEAAALGARAGMASRTNTLFSIPMLFFMGSASHLPGLAGQGATSVYWIAAGVIIALVEINGIVVKPGAPSQKLLTSVSGTIHGGLLLAAVLYVVAGATMS
jgi:uncharacterized membrane protein